MLCSSRRRLATIAINSEFLGKIRVSNKNILLRAIRDIFVILLSYHPFYQVVHEEYHRKLAHILGEFVDR